MGMKDYIQRFNGNGRTIMALQGVLKNMLSGVADTVRRGGIFSNSAIFEALDKARADFDEFLVRVGGRLADGREIRPDAFMRYLVALMPDIAKAWEEHRQEQGAAAQKV